MAPPSRARRLPSLPCPAPAHFLPNGAHAPAGAARRLRPALPGPSASVPPSGRAELGGADRGSPTPGAGVPCTFCERAQVGAGGCGAPAAGEGVSPPGSAPPPPSPRCPLRAKVPFPAPCCSRAPGMRQRRRGQRDQLLAAESRRGQNCGCSESRNFVGVWLQLADPGSRRPRQRGLLAQLGARASTGVLPLYPLHSSEALLSGHSLESSVCPCRRLVKREKPGAAFSRSLDPLWAEDSKHLLPRPARVPSTRKPACIGILLGFFCLFDCFVLMKPPIESLPRLAPHPSRFSGISGLPSWKARPFLDRL